MEYAALPTICVVSSIILGLPMQWLVSKACKKNPEFENARQLARKVSFKVLVICVVGFVLLYLCESGAPVTSFSGLSLFVIAFFGATAGLIIFPWIFAVSFLIATVTNKRLETSSKG